MNQEQAKIHDALCRREYRKIAPWCWARQIPGNGMLVVNLIPGVPRPRMCVTASSEKHHVIEERDFSTWHVSETFESNFEVIEDALLEAYQRKCRIK